MPFMKPMSSLLGRIGFLMLSLAFFWATGQAQAQTITGFTPTSGTTGTTVTITGTGFTGASTVAFNGIAGALFVQDDFTILTQVPSGATKGLISVTVGGNTVSSADTFYVGQSFPSITGFTPVSGTVGSNVTINGQNLNLIDSIRFNGTRATYNFLNATSIVGIVPVGATTGLIELFYQGIRYTSSSPYTVVAAPPTIISFSPTAGPTGTTVSIIGTNFTGITQITFNNVNAPIFTVHRPDSLTVVVPPSATTGQVRVTTSGGTSGSRQPFQVLNPTGPTITNFNPFNGPVGTTVTITGTNFNGLTTVLFNGTVASVTSSTNTQIIVNVPVGATTGNIAVVTTNGVATSNFPFTVTTTGAGICFNNPNTNNINPVGTWTSVTLQPGNAYAFTFNAQNNRTYSFSTCGATGNTVIRIYDQRNTLIVSNDDNGPYCLGSAASIDFTPTTPGQYRVLVTESPCIALTGTVTFQHRVGAVTTTPSLTNFLPTSGPVGTVVSLVGTNLTQITSVLLNGQACTISSQTNTLILITVPVGAITGTIRLNYNAGFLTTAPQEFTVTAPSASFCSATPLNRGTITPITTYQTVSGAQGSSPYWDFVATAGTTYTFSTCGSVFDTQIRIYDATKALKDSNDNDGPVCVGNAASLEFTPTTSGTYSLLLTGTNCTGLALAANLRYRLGGGLSINSIAPTSGPVGINVLVKGTGFVGVTAVQFGGGTVNATSYTVTTDSTISVTVPTGAVTGTICVVAGTKSTCSQQQFTVIATPTFCGPANITSIYPVLTVRTLPIIAGSREAYFFTGALNTTYAFSTCGVGTNDTKIRIYDASGAILATNDNDGPYCTGTKASINFAPTIAGDYFLIVTDADCNVLSANGDLTYYTLPVASAPIITGFNPNTGPVGTVVRILGRYFTNATNVNFNGTAASAYTVISDTLISATVGTGSTTGRISVVTPFGLGQSTSNFTVTNCTNVRIVINMTPQGGDQFRVFGGGGPGGGTTYVLDGTTTVGATGIFTAAPGIHTLRATNAQGCFAETAFRNFGVVTCGQRITGGGTGADTLTFYEVTAPALGATSLLLFDQGDAPERGRLFYQGATVATVNAFTNPNNLFYSPRNATTGTAVIEVKTRAGSSFGAWLNCPTTAATIQTLTAGNLNACGKQLVLSTYPARSTNTGTVISTLQAGTGRLVQLNIRALTLGLSDSIMIYDGATAAGTLLARLGGDYSTVTNTIITSTDTAMTVVYSGLAAGRGGFIFDVNCILNTTSSIAMGTLSSSLICRNSTITIPFVLTGPFVSPDTVKVEVSPTANFSNTFVLGQVITTVQNGIVTAIVPGNSLPGIYYVRLANGNSRSNQSSFTVVTSPAVPTIAASGPTALCQGNTLTLSANAPGVSGYIWSTGATTSSISVTTAGNYTLQTVVGSCTSAVSAPTIVTVNPSSAVSLVLRNDTVFAIGTSPGVTFQWSVNGFVQAAITTPYIVARFDGNYAATVTLGTCVTPSAPLLVVGLADGIKAGDLKLVPNPASGQVRLQLTTPITNAEVVLVNTLGQTVRTYNISTDETQGAELDLSGISAGTYMVHVVGTSVRKALVVR